MIRKVICWRDMTKEEREFYKATRDEYIENQIKNGVVLKHIIEDFVDDYILFSIHEGKPYLLINLNWEA